MYAHDLPVVACNRGSASTDEVGLGGGGCGGDSEGWDADPGDVILRWFVWVRWVVEVVLTS